MDLPRQEVGTRLRLAREQSDREGYRYPAGTVVFLATPDVGGLFHVYTEGRVFGRLGVLDVDRDAVEPVA